MIAKALRLRRLNLQSKFDKEQEIFELYTHHESDFDSVKAKLIALEMEIQCERNVGLWDSMYDLIINSVAATLYRQAFLSRRKANSKTWLKDLDDGSKPVRGDATSASATPH